MRVVSVIGTRPQLVKAAVVTRALRDDGRFDEVTVDTGQHYDHEMSTLLLDDLPDVQAKHNLDIHGDDEREVLDRMIEAIRRVLVEERPDVVVVYGDTNSTLAGARAASALDLPIAHVEAGLRSYNEAMREERNRVAVDQLANLLFCPTPLAVRNLAAEGIERGVHHVGDVMYDAALAARGVVEQMTTGQFEWELAPGEWALATIHRAENTDDPAALDKVLAYLREVAEGTPILFPVHPRTRKALARAGLSTDGFMDCEPVSYLEMTNLLMRVNVLYTDSGGLQKEAYFHRVPCVTLRSETEWVETIDAGWNRLWTVPDYKPRRDITDYGNGHASRAIVEVLASTLGAV